MSYSLRRLTDRIWSIDDERYREQVEAGVVSKPSRSGMPRPARARRRIEGAFKRLEKAIEDVVGIVQNDPEPSALQYVEEQGALIDTWAERLKSIRPTFEVDTSWLDCSPIAATADEYSILPISTDSVALPPQPSPPPPPPAPTPPPSPPPASYLQPCRSPKQQREEAAFDTALRRAFHLVHELKRLYSVVERDLTACQPSFLRRPGEKSLLRSYFAPLI